MVCLACSQLRAEGETVGCVLRDPATYGPVYRQMRRFDSDQLLAGAARCHLCEAAPCVAASPAKANIPAFIQAFRNGDETRAYEILRARDPLPELTARVSPGWLESEGACIETTLTGTPVPILDLQYAIAWRARARGETGVCIPQHSSGKTVAIVGGGPAGLAASVRLLKLGHTVHLYEQSDRLGGVAARLLSTSRQWSPRPEIDALLQPALAAARLQVHFGITLGQSLTLNDLRAAHDAILIATGLWQERTLGQIPGVVGSLAFLESPDQPVPPRVALLAGGDSAMDAAVTLQSRGAKEIFVIFGGPRSALHWHLPESWFASPGVHSMMNWQPLGYEASSTGHLIGVRLRHTELGIESVLRVDLVIEAMELQPAESIQAILSTEPAPHPLTLSPCHPLIPIRTAGALTNKGASVSHCIAEALAAAEAIHSDLSQ